MTATDEPLAAVRRWYRAAAVSNVVVTLPAFVAYDRMTELLAEDKPRYPFLVHIWAGMAMLWGVLFAEISRDPVSRYPMVKYSWMEKLVTSGAVTAAWRRHEVPGRLMVMIVVTDIVWVPVFWVLQLRVRSHARRSGR